MQKTAKRLLAIALLLGTVGSCAEPPPAAAGDGSAGPIALPADGPAAVDLGPADLPPAGDGAQPPDPATCTVPLMPALYPGGGPPNPYGPLPAADACVALRHDVIIVLGCPNNADGTPSACQQKRADLGMALLAAGLGDRFITSGSAVANPYVEAETLRDLLIARGVPAEHILTEPKARHTDENLYYSTDLMQAQGWRSALVVSDDPGHLILTAVCDSNCCVARGRLTVLTLPVLLPGHMAPAPHAVGHYALFPHAQSVSAAECTFIESPLKFMCVNLKTRLACAGRLMLP